MVIGLRMVLPPSVPEASSPFCPTRVLFMYGVSESNKNVVYEWWIWVGRWHAHGWIDIMHAVGLTGAIDNVGCRRRGERKARKAHGLDGIFLFFFNIHSF